MTTNTILLLLFSLIIAGGLSFYHYLYKAKNQLKLYWFLAFLRFLSIFLILVLLINPIISRSELVVEKVPLALVVDNSSSISFMKLDKIGLDLYEKIVSNSQIQDKFEVQSYSFDSDFAANEKFDFKGSQTNIDAVAKGVKTINRNRNFPTVLITDGNQTSGNDYVYSFDPENKVYPLVLGDTTQFLDLKINQINVNKYAFYKNKFPVEAFLSYTGSKSITADFSILKGNGAVSKERISFSPSKRTATVNVLLTADTAGLQVFKAILQSNEKEKNTFNNTKNFAVEILNQKTNIALVSEINHPDVGALKRAIETNVQRKVSIVKPLDIKVLQDFNVFIFYQPTPSFKAVFEANKAAKISSLIITGMSTDFGFLNQQQSICNFKMSGQAEDFLGEFNPDFNLFATENINFQNFPPLQNPFGTIKTTAKTEVLLRSKIRNISTNQPLLVFSENNGTRSALLFGENSWKWRLQSHINTKSFEKYDAYIDKTIQYLATNNSKKSLVVTHENFYNSGEAITITAQYFNKNFEFDEKARLSIMITNTKSKQTKNYDLLKTSNSFKVNLDGLPGGSYDFSVKELNSKSTYSSHFEIIDFDIEKQFVNPDVNKLTQLAEITGGNLTYPDQVDELIKALLDQNQYKPIQKTNTIKSPLIDWYWLLILIVLLLFAEWFIRKYNGLL